MIIKDIFDKDIDRDIKGVIKVGQGDEVNIKQELEEYVVTKELSKHFTQFFSSYKKGILGNTDKMGVWISGFFGSGKSHFLKILSYILENRKVNGKNAIDYFIDDNKIEDQVVLGDMKLACNNSIDVILFNIDSKSGMSDTRNNKEAILSVLIKVFNEHLGYYGSNPHLADLEKDLDDKGKYQKFKDTFKKLNGSEWTEARNKYKFLEDDVRKTMVDIGYVSEEAAKNIYESFGTPYNIDILTFTKSIKEYIEKKGNNHQVVFLIDEIGQYIGEKTDLMLNLQTITEDLGTECQGKAWIIVTSQQDIDDVIKVKGNDFSKIQGRFDTRLSLSSSNVDEVINKRILNKTTTAKETLSLLYDEKENTIKNLISFDDGIHKVIYSNRENFVNVYPFVQYQFNLLGEVLTSIRTRGATGKHLAEGERSMLGLFKESAIKVMGESEGRLVSFDMFYDPLEQFIDHSHRNVISKAYENEYINTDKSKDCFEVNVLKTLFMIKYADNKIKSTLYNITSLMVSNINEDRLTLSKKVEESLKRLCKQTLVQKNGENYVFLTNEEQEINRVIENQTIDNYEVTNKISEIFFDGLYENKNYKLNKNKGRYFFGFNQILDGVSYKGNQNNDISLKIITHNYTDIVVEEDTLKLTTERENSVIVVIPNDKGFIEELRSSIKIEKFLRLNTESNIIKHKEIKGSKEDELKERKNNAKILFESALSEMEIYVNGTKETVSNGGTSSIDNALGKLVDRVYNKLDYIDTPKEIEDIKRLFKGEDPTKMSIDGKVQSQNELALKDLKDFIGRNSQNHIKTSLKSIKERFMKAPYGFIDIDIQWLIAKLFKDEEISLFLNNETISVIDRSLDEIIKYMTKKEFVEKLLIETREKASDKDKKISKEVIKELFNITIRNDKDDEIFRVFKENSMKLKNDLTSREKDYEYQDRYPGVKVIKNGKKLLLDLISIDNPTEFFKRVIEKKDDLLDFAEDYEDVKKFFESDQIEIWKKGLKQIDIYNESKVYIVDKDIEKLVEDIEKILKNSNPYGEIRKLPELLERYILSYGDLFDKEGEPVLKEIEEAETRVMEEIEGTNLYDTMSEEIRKKFKEIKEKAETTNNIAKLKSIIQEVDVLKIREINNINEIKEKLIEENEIKENSDETKKTIIKPKKTNKTISIKTVNTHNTWKIEKEEDLDKYILELKEKLKKKIEENTILNIEF